MATVFFISTGSSALAGAAKGSSSKAQRTRRPEGGISVDSVLPGAYYKRAWELVNATDTEYLKYVAELSK
jgi:hypothetical protein